MADLVINGGSQTLDGTKNYDNVTITNSGILYVTPYNGTGTTGTLILNVTNNVYVDATSSINGFGRGYTGGPTAGDGVGGNGGNGPGAGTKGGNSYQCLPGQTGPGGGGGGGYGTVGGGGGGGGTSAGGCSGLAGGTGGSTYGTTNGSDISMGSGGGSGGGGYLSGAGGAGGSALTINADNIYIYGTLNFNGGAGGIGRSSAGTSNGSGGGGGGASGGGIKLSAKITDITGATISAAGGDRGPNGPAGTAGTGGYGGYGGGGRIKMFYLTLLNTGATITAGTVYYEMTGGSASFTSSPPDARIWIDDVDTGINTPNTISGLSVGSHNYTLKLAGYQDATDTFSVTAGQTTTIPLVTLIISLPSAYFTSNPTGATIWIDDVNIGQVTPYTKTGLSVGSHTYRLIKVGYTNRGSFSTIAGQTTNVSATLTAVGLNGSIWIEDQYLCYINANNVVTYISSAS